MFDTTIALMLDYCFWSLDHRLPNLKLLWLLRQLYQVNPTTFGKLPAESLIRTYQLPNRQVCGVVTLI
ncbi:MAG: hypothetical protein F6K56_25580 [Moorea sp. SIO3G5]|nr:hypothetical protein [Moorena sp. SIO3G5]